MQAVGGRCQSLGAELEALAHLEPLVGADLITGREQAGGGGLSQAGCGGGLIPWFRPRERRAFWDAKSEEVPEELLERATRLVFESGRPIAHVARDLGVPSETLRVYVRRVEANDGRRNDVLSDGEREEIRKLRRENFELRRANEILKSASVFFAKELDPDRTK